MLVVHDLNLAASCADQLVMLNCGRLVAQGAPEYVLSVDLIEQVFNVTASIGVHPRTGSPMVIV